LTIAEVAARLLERVRAEGPVVHHITNPVTANDVANATLAVGAFPVMAYAREEVEEIVSRASALCLNLGTPTPSRLDAMLAAGLRAAQRGIPVVFDPVGVGASGLRAAGASRLLREVRVAAVRGNLAEMAHLAGQEGVLRGVQSAGAAGAPEEVARQVALRHRVVAAVTGPRDWVSDGARLVRVDNGHPLLERVAGSGCMATAVVACFLAVADDFVAAAAAALAYFGYAAELAAQAASGPGTFRACLLDRLAQLGPEDLLAGVRAAELARSTPSPGG